MNNPKRSYINVLISLLLLVMLIYIFNVYKEKHKYDTIETGQIWTKSYHKDNPYREEIIDSLYVIGIKDGYVLYVLNRTDTLSISNHWFLVNAELLKK